jgi:3-phosphoshikimate 1-carboxyvinyltransferase
MSGKLQSKTLVVRQARRLSGTVQAPPSKSYTHRAIIIGSLDGSHRVMNPLFCDDTRNTIALFRKLGARIERNGKNLVVRGFAGRPELRGRGVNVGESGTLLRLALSILPLANGNIAVKGEGSLRGRPNKQVVDVLQNWGVVMKGRGRDAKLPILIEANGLIPGGKAVVEGGVTSQVISSLLIAAPFAEADTVLEVGGKLVSRPYVDITIDVLKWAGIRVERSGYRRFCVRHGQKLRPKNNFTVHGDYSSAAFLLAAAALTESDVTVTDLVNDCQGDRKSLGILRAMGAKVERTNDAVRLMGPFKLVGIDIDGADTPDLVPILSVLGCFAKGTTRIRNVAHLVHKESNRLTRPAAELRKLGARISFTRDELVIKHARLHSGSVSASNDHRIAMALAVAGCAIDGGVTIRGAECISKSYPGFVSDMRKLGARIGVSR